MQILCKRFHFNILNGQNGHIFTLERTVEKCKIVGFVSLQTAKQVGLKARVKKGRPETALLKCFH